MDQELVGKEKEKLMEQVKRMVAILIICWQLLSRYTLDENEEENVLQQREVVGNLEDDTDEELLKQVGFKVVNVCEQRSFLTGMNISWLMILNSFFSIFVNFTTFYRF